MIVECDFDLYIIQKKSLHNYVCLLYACVSLFSVNKIGVNIHVHKSSSENKNKIKWIQAETIAFISFVFNTRFPVI